MTYRTKNAARKSRQVNEREKRITRGRIRDRARELRLRSAVEEAIRRRPPHVEYRSTTPEVVYSNVAGPASSFAVGHIVDADPSIGSSPTKSHWRHTIGPRPEQRQIQVWLPPAPPSRLFDGSSLSPIDSMVETVLLKAVRMRLSVSGRSSVNRIEWWTWEPVDGTAYPAVREARAICDRLVQIADGFQWWASVPAFEKWSVEELRDRAEEIRMKLSAVRVELLRIADYAKTVGNAADEWLGTPRPHAEPATDESCAGSRW